MGSEKPVRRLTLRQLMTQSEKFTRDLIETYQSQFLPRNSEFREMSRPVRRRSQFPSMLALQNSLRKFQQVHDEVKALAGYLLEHLDAIREQAKKERMQKP